MNKSSSELTFWKEFCQETSVKFSDSQKMNNEESRSFFGYYNFHNFFNHFVILYERLKLIKSLTDRHGAFHFMKQVMVLNFANVISTELFEDVIGSLLSEYNGVFLNLEKILANIVKELPSHEIDRFVTGVNQGLFGINKQFYKKNLNTFENISENLPALLLKNKLANLSYPNKHNEEEWLFLKTCHKLSILTYKSKANCKQSQIQSYINNNNLVNDHLLKFEFRIKEQVFVIHKIKSFYKQQPKQVSSFIF